MKTSVASQKRALGFTLSWRQKGIGGSWGGRGEGRLSTWSNTLVEVDSSRLDFVCNAGLTAVMKCFSSH